MTKELQKAMAHLEECRIRYRAAVRGSLDGTSDGAAIWDAIQAFRAAHVELSRFHSSDSRAAPQSVRDGSRLRNFVERFFRERSRAAS
jgi:hypothetical protein